MAIPKLLLTLVGTLAASCSAAVLKPYFNSPTFEVYTASDEAPLFQSGIPSFLATPILPIPIQYGKADCDHDNLVETNLVAAFDKETKNKLIYDYNPQVSILPFIPELQINMVGTHNDAKNYNEKEKARLVSYEERKFNFPSLILSHKPITPKTSPPENIVVLAAEENAPYNEVYQEPNKSESVTIPEAPMLPPLSITEVPFEKSDGDCDSRTYPKMSEMEEKINNSIMIPEAPTLSPLLLSDLSTKNKKDRTSWDDIIFVQEEEKVNDLPVTIPEAPILSGFSMLELPRAVVEELPVIKEVALPIEQTVMIPSAPELTLLNAPILATNREPKPCDEVTFVQEEPKINDVPITIPEAPILPVFSMPKLPTRGFVEELPEIKEPALPKVEQNIPIITPETPERALLTEPSIFKEGPEPHDEVTFIQEPKIQNVPITIPEAPILSDFSIPELPRAFVEELPVMKEFALPIEQNVMIPTAPELPLLNAPKLPTNRNIKPCDEVTFVQEELKINDGPITIPEAPILPVFTMPILPTRAKVEELPKIKEPALPKVEQNVPVMIPEAPERALLTEPSIINEGPKPHDEVTFIRVEPKIQNVPITIPEAPTLPAFSMPEFRTKSNFEDMPVIKELTMSTEPKVEEIIPIMIPEAPELAPMSVQEPFIIVQTQSQAYDEIEVNKENLKIAEAPILPDFSMPELPTRVSADLPEVKTTNVLPEISLASVPVQTKFEPRIDSETKLFEHINLAKILTPTLRAPSPIIFQAPMQLVVHGSDIPRMGGAENCLYNYLTDRTIVKNIV